MYYYSIRDYYNVWTIFRASKKYAHVASYAFIMAPRKDAILKAGVRIVKGAGVKSLPLSDIEMGRRRTFLWGGDFSPSQAIRFRGTPKGVEELRYGNCSKRCLKIEINPDVMIFIKIDHEGCCFQLQLI